MIHDSGLLKANKISKNCHVCSPYNRSCWFEASSNFPLWSCCATELSRSASGPENTPRYPHPTDRDYGFSKDYRVITAPMAFVHSQTDYLPTLDANRLRTFPTISPCPNNSAPRRRVIVLWKRRSLLLEIALIINYAYCEIDQFLLFASRSKYTKTATIFWIKFRDGKQWIR